MTQTLLPGQLPRQVCGDRIDPAAYLRCVAAGCTGCDVSSHTTLVDRFSTARYDRESIDMIRQAPDPKGGRRKWRSSAAPAVVDVSEVEVVREALKHAAKMLDRKLNSLSGTGTLGDLKAQGMLNSHQLGDWDAGQMLEITAKQAYEHITQGYDELLGDYEAAIGALLRVASIYDEAEGRTAEQIKAIMAGH